MSATEVLQAPDLVFERSDELGSAGHEQVVFCRDKESGLQAIIAIHDTTLGPALGGTRMYPYRSEAAALKDVLRLSRGMTFKSAAAGMDLGGGKAVIMGGQGLKTRELLLAYGRFVQTLGGRYYTAADVGT
ncbi:MAG: Glu/Leu/Phe/Val dehydrogenase dimerization domain-containing protein, partial [Trebonia sp.]